MSRREGQRKVPAAPLPRALLGSNPVLGLRSRLGFFSRDHARGQGRQPWAPGAAGRGRDDSGEHGSCRRSRDPLMKAALAPGARSSVRSLLCGPRLNFSTYRTQPGTTFVRTDHPERSERPAPYADCPSRRASRCFT